MSDRRNFLKKILLIALSPSVLSNQFSYNDNSKDSDLKGLEIPKLNIIGRGKTFFVDGFEYLVLPEYAHYSEMKRNMLHIWITPNNENKPKIQGATPIYLCDEEMDGTCNTGIIKKEITKEQLKYLISDIPIKYNHLDAAVFHYGSRRFKKIGEENKEAFQKLYDNTLDRILDKFSR